MPGVFTEAYYYEKQSKADVTKVFFPTKLSVL